MSMNAGVEKATKTESRTGPGRAMALGAVRLALSTLDAVSPKLSGRLVYALMFYAGRRRLSTAEKEGLRRARRRGFVQDGLEIPVYEWGERGRPAVLAVHGYEGAGAHFLPLVERCLAAGLRVVSFDAPGHGLAPGTGTNLVQMFQIGQRILAEHGPFCAIVGHSIGAMATTQLALDAPSSIRQVALVAGVFESSTFLRSFQEMTGASDAAMGEAIRRTERTLNITWGAFEPPVLAPKQRIPALVIHDRDDKEVPPGEAARYASAGPPATVVMTDGLGHRRILRDRAVIERIVESIVGECSATGSVGG
jgi:pimeloyl-ACP methyl ester carboxylesterase